MITLLYLDYVIDSQQVREFCFDNNIHLGGADENRRSMIDNNTDELVGYVKVIDNPKSLELTGW